MSQVTMTVPAEGRNTQTALQKLRDLSRKPGSLAAAVLVHLCAFISFSVLIFLVAFILVKGVSSITPDLFAWEYNSENVSLMPALLNTVVLTVMALLIAAPLGVLSAIFLVEYAKHGSRLVRLIRIAAETLSGIPSIVYGLFGLLFFSGFCGMKVSMLSGCLTVVIMVLPLIMRTTEEALIAVPDAYREASFGLGAGKLRTIVRAVLPTAVPGILSGIILATGRIIGETAALLYTAGTVAQNVFTASDGVMASTRTLALHMYVLSTEGLHMEQAYATAVILLAVVLAINALSSFLAKLVVRER